MDTIKKSGVQNTVLRNWSETYQSKPELLFHPADLQELSQILELARFEGKKVRVVGCGHSPNDLPFTDGYAISLLKFNQLLEVNVEECCVKVQGGMVMTDLVQKHLPKHGLAIPVMGSVTEVTIAGAISVATHGSCLKYGTLCSLVEELELMTADGQVVSCSRTNNPDLFSAATCGLGAMGIIISITLKCERVFNLELKQSPMVLQDVLEHLSVHLNCSDFFNFKWFPHTDHVIANHFIRTEKVPSRGNIFTRFCDWIWSYAIGFYVLEACYWLSTFWPSMVPFINKVFFWILFSKPRSIVANYHELLQFECLFSQFVTEWAIPIDKTAVVLYELREWLSKTPEVMAHFPVEVRFVKGEDTWLSPAYGRDTCYINLVCYRPYKRTFPHKDYWTAYEKIALKYDGRPHWAKEHSLRKEDLSRKYPKFLDWCGLRRKQDPSGLFLNSHLNRLIAEP